MQRGWSELGLVDLVVAVLLVIFDFIVAANVVRTFPSLVAKLATQLVPFSLGNLGIAAADISHKFL